MAAAPHLKIESRPASFYLPELDSLRFFAFLAVFVSHVSLVYGLPSLWSHVLAHGVDLFFALSAFLLTELMLREKDSNRFGRLDLGAFYLRRALRIWPLYYGFLLLVLCLTMACPVRGIPHGALAMYALLLGDLPLTAPFSLIVVSLWSISLEEQFYLIWPNLVQRLSRAGVGRFAITGWVAAALLRVVMFATGHGLAGLVILIHLDSIFAGLLIVGFRLRGGRWLCISGAVMWALGTFYTSHDASPALVSLAYVGIGLGSAAFLLSCMCVSRLTNRATVYLGRISYGLYVFHGAALVVAMTMLPALAAPVAALAATLALAAASYRWFESPFLRLKRRFQYVSSQPV
jgi:peptidoglycan/LPS O-acetylase OafA/YrhL